MQNFSHLVLGEDFQVWGWMNMEVGKCAFSTENWPYLRNSEDKAKVTINHFQEVLYALSDEMKIIDFGCP